MQGPGARRNSEKSPLPPRAGGYQRRRSPSWCRLAGGGNVLIAGRGGSFPHKEAGVPPVGVDLLKEKGGDIAAVAASLSPRRMGIAHSAGESYS